MNNSKRALTTIILIGSAAFSGIAMADNCSGTWNNVGQSADTQDLGGGVKLTSFLALSTDTFKESGEMRVGACSGYVLALPDGKIRLVFGCARRNSAGDVAVDEGSLEPGAEKGTWKITSATGALAKTVGDSGWWKGTIENGKVSAGIWGGTCTR